MISDEDYNEMLQKLEQETKIQVSFKTREMNDTIAGKIQEALGGNSELEFAVVELPLGMLDALCKAALIGSLAASEMGLATQVELEGEETLQDALQTMFASKQDAEAQLSGATMACTYLTEKGARNEDRKMNRSLSAPCYAPSIPTMARQTP